MMRAAVFSACLAAVSLAPLLRAQHPIIEIKVAGNQRLPAKAIVAASGLRTGQMIARAGLDAAAQKLADTGFFESVSYRYDPKTSAGATGYSLTLQISEFPSLAHVEMDFPGVDSAQLWQQLKAANGLLDRDIPDNERAAAYLKRAVETALKKENAAQEIVLKNEANLRNGKMIIICRPANLPRIAQIRFAGNAAVRAASLEGAMSRVSVGQEYSERDFRRMLEFNVRPLYEELGRLTVVFRQIDMAPATGGAVSITATIDEGPVWMLGTIRLLGDQLPVADMHDAARFETGAPANWKKFTACVDQMEQMLRHEGYIAVTSRPVRSFRDKERIVDVNIEVAKGAQYRFGELHIEGLDEYTQEKLASYWKLPAGAPMDQPYVNEFVRSVSPMLRGKFRSFGSELNVHKDALVVDVNLKFR